MFQVFDIFQLDLVGIVLVDRITNLVVIHLVRELCIAENTLEIVIFVF